MSRCTGCGIMPQPSAEQWWHLNDYYGFTGFYCPDCYDKISHDSYGNPQDPEGFTLMLLKNQTVDK